MTVGEEGNHLPASCQNMYDHSPIGYFILDEHGVIVGANPAGAQLLNKPPSGLIHTSFVHYIADEDKER
jgi:PAS domain-containing protein